MNIQTYLDIQKAAAEGNVAKIKHLITSPKEFFEFDNELAFIDQAIHYNQFEVIKYFIELALDEYPEEVVPIILYEDVLRKACSKGQFDFVKYCFDVFNKRLGGAHNKLLIEVLAEDDYKTFKWTSYNKEFKVAEFIVDTMREWDFVQNINEMLDDVYWHAVREAQIDILKFLFQLAVKYLQTEQRIKLINELLTYSKNDYVSEYLLSMFNC